MGESAENLNSKLGLDTTDFKTGLDTANRALRVLESGFKASVASLGDWANSVTGLEARQKSLTSQIDIQKAKVAALREEYDRQVAANGDMSIAAQNAEVRLNKETERLGAMQVELGETNTNLKTVSEGNTKAGQSAENSVSGWQKLQDMLSKVKTGLAGVKSVASDVGKTVKAEAETVAGVFKVGAGAVLGLGAAAVAASTAVAGFTLKEAASAKELEDMSVKTGISVQRLQELSYIGGQLGVDLDTIATSNSRLIKSMDLSSKPTSTAAKAFSELGVQVRDSNGQLLDSNVVFANTLQALSKIKDPTERDAIAMEIFGRNAAELGPLADEGAAGLAKLTDEADKNGSVVSTKTVGALASLQAKLNGLKSGLSGLAQDAAGAFAPFLGGMLTGAQGYLGQLVGLFQGAGGDISKIVNGYSTTPKVDKGALDNVKSTYHEGILGMVTGLIKDLAAQAPKMVQSGITIVQGLITAISSALPTILGAGVQIITMLAQAIITNLPMLGQTAATLLSSLASAILPLLPTLMNVGIQILMTLGRALIAALPVLIPQLAATASQLVTQLLAAIQELFPQLLPVAVQLIQTLISFLQNNLVQLITIGLPIINQLVQSILMQLPQLVSAALKVVIALANGLVAALPTLIPTIVKVLLLIVQTIITNLPMLLKAALQLILALVQGLVVALPILIAAVPQILQAIVDALTTMLPMLIQMAPQIIMALITGIIGALPVLAKAIPKIIQTIIDMITTLLPMLVKMAPQIIVSLITGILEALPQLIVAALQIIVVLIAALIGALPQIILAAIQIIVALVQGIIQSIPLIVAAVPKIISAFTDATKQGLPKILEAGVSILEGVWKGIESKLAWFWDKVRSFALGIWQHITEAIRGGSPSELFAETTGPSIVTGIWKGIEKTMPQLQNQLKAAMQGLSGSYAIGVNGMMPAFAGVPAGVGASAGAAASNTSQEIHLHVGTLIADRAGLEQLERTLLKIRQVEEVRKG
ncbi:MAG: phage tail tape measure protein [Anaerolineales bacterium]|jgi:phage-related protein